MLCFVVQNILPLIEITVPGFEKNKHIFCVVCKEYCIFLEWKNCQEA